LRRSSFAAHALSHIGFAGAAGAVLVGVSPVFGLLLFTSVGGIGMTVLGPRASHRDVQIGTVLAFMLGLGVLFISLYTGYATEAYSILFGEILGISSIDVLVTAIAALVILCAVAFVFRPLSTKMWRKRRDCTCICLESFSCSWSHSLRRLQFK
jgi:zinc/manganese transport system permease protein